MKQLRSVGVHDGPFHADEVAACALLMTFGLVDRNKIIRTRDEKKLERCEYICDVGGVYDPDQKRFDHHQVEYQGSLSSAGMILKELCRQNVISDEEFQFFRSSLIHGIDAHDNGKAVQEYGYCTISHVIANFNPPVYDATLEQLNAGFFQALDFTVSHLKRLHERLKYNKQCRQVVKEAMEKDQLCLYFDRAVPWLENFFALEGEKHPALFIIMPAGEYWKLRGIPPDYAHRMQVRMPLPEKWAGLLGEQLAQVSEIPGAVFCHKGRFTSVWKTREDALRALKKIFIAHGIEGEDHI